MGKYWFGSQKFASDCCENNIKMIWGLTSKITCENLKRLAETSHWSNAGITPQYKLIEIKRSVIDYCPLIKNGNILYYQ